MLRSSEVRARVARGRVVRWTGMERSQFWWVKLVSKWLLEIDWGRLW